MTLILKAHQNRKLAIQAIRAREINVFADDFAHTRRARPGRTG